MATGTTNGVLRYLRQAVLARDGGGMTDGQLLKCFLARREEAAFAALVRRHGPMVLGVCRRLLANEHDAEDAFQATFLVLARKAAAVVPRDLVGNWLYGVACRTALKAKAAATRRRVMERQVTAMPEHPAEPADVWHDLQPLLDQELQRLPDKYRVPVVLCDLEGRARKEVARHLGIPEGTLSSRLATARKRLAGRLTRRGLALSAGSLALALAQNAASASVSAALAGPTATAATLFAAGRPIAGLVSAEVAALAEGVLKTMLLARLKAATVLLLALAVFGTGARIMARQAPAAEPRDRDRPHLEQKEDTPPAPGLPGADQNDDGRKDDKDDGRRNQKDIPKKQKDDDDDDDDDDDVQGVVRAVDVSKNTITVAVSRKRNGAGQTFNLAKDVQVRVAGKASNLSGVIVGMRVALKLSEDKKAVVGIKEEGQKDKDRDQKSAKKTGASKGEK